MSATTAAEKYERPFPGLSTQKLAVWLFLASEIMFFAGLIVAYITIRYSSADWPVVSEVLNVPLVALNTFILIVSSVTMVLAFDHAERGDGRFRYLLLVTALLGIIFLGIQAFEWRELLQEGIRPSSDLFGATFFTLTGFHGAHVTGGVIWVLWATAKAFRGGYSENPIGVELAGLYWHFVDLVWIILFTIIYLI
jgi:heme/copper-type cytochrome/quinol oxidase subunit 3